MPSFAKLASAPASMADVMKDSPHQAVVNALRDEYRTRAGQILREEMPAKITRIQELLKGENDPPSPFWVGHTSQGDYLHPRMAQPGDIVEMAKSGITENDVDVKKLILPGQIVRAVLENGDAKGANGIKLDGVDDNITETEKGVRVGAHWFEVVAPNAIQTQIVSIICKEAQDMHMMCMDLRVWLDMEVPLIEDGNSFGADVQAHLIRELENVGKKANQFQNGANQHWSDRSKLAKDWAVHPNLTDIPAAIAASDRFDHHITRSYLRNMLMTYGGLLTKFERNWAKVINPKSNASAGGMY